MTNAAVAVMFTAKCWYIHGHLLEIRHTIHPLFPIIYLCMVFLMIFLVSQNIITGYRGHKNVQTLWKKS
jgi:hypothetical protein